MGKSRLALDLAAKYGGEIISADSVKIYKGLDVGSNKKSLIEASKRLNIPVHLVDIINVYDYYSMGDYSDAARNTISDIISRGKLPIVVGGTGFYINGVTMGTSGAPMRDVSLSNDIIYTIKQYNWDDVIAYLATYDSEAAKKISRNNYVRLARDLEILLLSGSPKSKFKPNSPLPYDIRAFCLTLSERDRLFEIIDNRCEKMVLDGLLQETIDIFSQYDTLYTNLPAVQSIGYKHALNFLYQPNPTITEFNLFLNQFKSDSRTFGRKQLSWFRNISYVPYIWCDCQKYTDDDLSQHLSKCIDMNWNDYKQEVHESQWLSEYCSAETLKKLRLYISKPHYFQKPESINSLLDQLQFKLSLNPLPSKRSILHSSC